MTQNQTDLLPTESDYQKMIDDLYQSLDELSKTRQKLADGDNS